jgi:hypothetical protein
VSEERQKWTQLLRKVVNTFWDHRAAYNKPYSTIWNEWIAYSIQHGSCTRSSQVAITAAVAWET